MEGFLDSKLPDIIYEKESRFFMSINSVLLMVKIILEISSGNIVISHHNVKTHSDDINCCAEHITHFSWILWSPETHSIISQLFQPQIKCYFGGVLLNGAHLWFKIMKYCWEAISAVEVVYGHVDTELHICSLTIIPIIFWFSIRWNL